MYRNGITVTCSIKLSRVALKVGPGNTLCLQGKSYICDEGGRTIDQYSLAAHLTRIINISSIKKHTNEKTGIVYAYLAG